MLKGDYMIKHYALIMKFVVLGIIYIVLFRIIKVMYLDLKGIKPKSRNIDYALEVEDAPDSLPVTKGGVYPVHVNTSIGRNEDNMIVLDDPYISSNHAEVYIDDDRLYIRDLGSTNGTYKNGQRIDGTVEISKGDLIGIGRITFKVIG